jgi:hypothetical protein
MRRKFQCGLCHHPINWWLRLANVYLGCRDGFGPLCWRCYVDYIRRTSEGQIK